MFRRNCQIYGGIEVIKEEHGVILKIIILAILPATVEFFLK